MKAKFFLTVLLAVFLFNGCFNKSKDISEQDQKTSPYADVTTDKGSNYGRSTSSPTTDEASYDKLKLVKDQPLQAPVMTDRMIVRKGNLSIEIENYDESSKRVTEEVAKAKGFVTNSTSSVNTSGKKQGTIEARVPAENYDAFIAGLSSIGKVMTQNISGTDVTEEYIDLEARQLTQKELEKRLLNLLNEKTANLTDVVDVEQKLATVRENIERTEGRMRFLKNQSAFSTLTVSLYEPSMLQTSSGGGFFYEIGEAMKKGMSGFTEVLSGLIAFVIAFSPILIFIMVVLIVVRKIVAKRKKQKTVLNPQAN